MLRSIIDYIDGGEQTPTGTDTDTPGQDDTRVEVAGGGFDVTGDLESVGVTRVEGAGGGVTDESVGERTPLLG